MKYSPNSYQIKTQMTSVNNGYKSPLIKTIANFGSSR